MSGFSTEPPLDDGVDDTVVVAAGEDVTSIDNEDFVGINTCPSAFLPEDSPFGELALMELTVRVRDALGAEIEHPWVIVVEPAIISGDVTGLRIVPPEDDVDLLERIWSLVSMLPFYEDVDDYPDDEEPPSPSDDVWPIGEEASFGGLSFIDGASSGFPVNVFYDLDDPHRISFRDELYDWGVALRATASRCDSVPPPLQPDPEDLELRVAGGEWKQSWSAAGSSEEELEPPIFDSSVFDISGDENTRVYSSIVVDIRHTEMTGEIWRELPTPCFMYHDVGMGDEPSMPVPDPDVGDPNDYAECMHPEDKEKLFEEWQDFDEKAMICAGEQIPSPGGGDPLAPMFEPCLPFEDMPDIDGWDWKEVIIPPHFGHLTSAWCATADDMMCGIGSERISRLSEMLWADHIDDAYDNMRDNADVNAPVTPGEPGAIFVSLNVIAGNIVDHFGPMGEGWDQLASMTGDNRFQAVGHQAFVEPLVYGVVGGIYAAAAWIPALSDGSMDYDEYVSHVGEAASATAVLGALHAFDNYYE